MTRLCPMHLPALALQQSPGCGLKKDVWTRPKSETRFSEPHQEAQKSSVGGDRGPLQSRIYNAAGSAIVAALLIPAKSHCKLQGSRGEQRILDSRAGASDQAHNAVPSCQMGLVGGR